MNLQVQKKCPGEINKLLFWCIICLPSCSLIKKKIIPETTHRGVKQYLRKLWKVMSYLDYTSAKQKKNMMTNFNIDKYQALLNKLKDLQSPLVCKFSEKIKVIYSPDG